MGEDLKILRVVPVITGEIKIKIEVEIEIEVEVKVEVIIIGQCRSTGR